MHSSSGLLPASPNSTPILDPNSSRGAQGSMNSQSPLIPRPIALETNLIGATLAFEPHVQSTIKVGNGIGFNYGANIYDENHNLIISCPSSSQVHFLDGSNFAPHSTREVQKIDSSVIQMSYDAETGTYLLGCAFGDIYSYNPSTDTLTKVLKRGDTFVLAISHIGADTFAFSSSNSKQLYFGSLSTSEMKTQYSKNSDAWYLQHIKEQGVLLAGLANGQIAIYSTRKDTKNPLKSLVQAHAEGKFVSSVINANIKGHNYIISASNDKTIKIWGLIKGKMRMLKVINTEAAASTIVYLEKYQMIATTHHSDYVKFYKVPTGELKATVQLKEAKKTRNVFLMRDKNAIGVADLNMNVIEVVQLHPSEKETEVLLDKEAPIN